MKDYLLIFRDHERKWAQFSPSDMQHMIERFDAWRVSIEQAGTFLGAGKLTQSLGATVRKAEGDFLVDGPFCEAKEAVSGYYCVRVSDEAVAIEMAKGFPMLDFGASVEVRQLEFLQGARM